MCVKRSHGREISIELKTGMKCVAARSIKSAIEFVFAHVKDTGRLAYWNLRGQRCSSSPWHGYLPTAFDYRCVGGGRGRDLTIESRSTRICVEKEIDLAMY